MKRTGSVCTLIMTALLVSSCGPVLTASSGQILADVSTAVAMTVTAQSQLASPATTVSPTSTPTSASAGLPILALAAAVTATPGGYSYTTASSCDDSAFVKDVTIPDGTVLTPGEEFVKTWKLENTGSCAWDTNYSLVLTGGYAMDGSSAALDQLVKSGRKANISVSLVAPDADGTYYGYWNLADDAGNAFGAAVYVEIVVSESAATATPTATSTQTNTPAPATSPTSTVAASPTPTVPPPATSTTISTATAMPTTASATVLTATATPTATSTIVSTPTTMPTATSTLSATFTAPPTPTDNEGPVQTSTPTAKPTHAHGDEP